MNTSTGRRLLRIAAKAALTVGQAISQAGFLYLDPPAPAPDRRPADSSREAR